MLKYADEFLNGITMYRLMLYELILLLFVAVFLSFLKVLPFEPVNLIFQASILISVCWGANKIFAHLFKAPANLESTYITALILFLIINPVRSYQEAVILVVVGVLAMASKYILATGKKHIFNPAAFAVFATALVLNYSAGWWIGNIWMAPFVILGGILTFRKLKRFDLVISFFCTSLAVFLFFAVWRGNSFLAFFQKIFLETPLFFFAFVMLTEPQTTPPSKKWKILYGAFVGFLYASPLSIGQFSTTPETALILGNIFSYIVGLKKKLILELKEKKQIGLNIYDFIFNLKDKLSFLPGQYMEWTLGHQIPDSRGNRRFFTIASAPTEKDMLVAIRVLENSSSFKKALLNLSPGGKLVASNPDGEFVLPKDQNKKLVFIAGGIGITPFRSMIKYLLDKSEKRDIVLFYINKTAEEIVFKEIFDEAFRKLDIKTVYVLTDKENIPKGWKGRVGHLGGDIIRKDVFDFRERIFYISGSHSMTESLKEILKGIEVSDNQIKTDYFPGYA